MGAGVRKLTKLVVTDEQVAKDLAKTCTKDHDHRPIEGVWRVDGKRVNASEFAGGYTEEFCLGVLESFKKDSHSECVRGLRDDGFRE